MPITTIEFNSSRRTPLNLFECDWRTAKFKGYTFRRLYGYGEYEATKVVTDEQHRTFPAMSDPKKPGGRRAHPLSAVTRLRDPVIAALLCGAHPEALAEFLREGDWRRDKSFAGRALWPRSVLKYARALADAMPAIAAHVERHRETLEGAALR